MAMGPDIIQVEPNKPPRKHSKTNKSSVLGWMAGSNMKTSKKYVVSGPHPPSRPKKKSDPRSSLLFLFA